jgi:hypothetical protein
VPAVTHRDYTPMGGMARLWRCREPECLASGPAGTGKTRGLLELCHLRALKYPGSRSLITRKERSTLTQTALVTWDREVCPDLDGVRWCASDLEYRYPNGSAVVVAGLDREGRKVMSGQYDFVYPNEATELSEAEWEVLTTRLRNAVAPYQQIAGDCNPDAPSHWLKRRCDSGRTLLFEVRHRDNPTLWQGNAWTPRGADYLAKLDALTGARRLRLKDGRWVQAEGVVYEGWDASLHVIDPFPVPQSWPRLWAVDFGYTHPFCCGWWARDPDGRLYLYREIYHTQRLVEDHARQMARLSAGEPRPLAVVCDHDAEDRATLERHLHLLTTPARKEVSPGIQAVAARLRPAGDGRPRLFLMRGALVERDRSLADAKKPTCTAEEVDSYVWNLTGGRRKGEEPVKALDDGMDQMRYAVSHFDLAPRVGRSASAGGQPAPAGSPYRGAGAYGPRGGAGYGPRG